MSDWGKVEIEFNFDSLLRADPKERAERDSIRINSAQITPNESRNAEGLLDKEGGDKLFINGALVPVDELTIENQGVQNENN